MTVAQLKGYAQHVGLQPEGKALKGDWIRMISVSSSSGHPLNTLLIYTSNAGTLRNGIGGC